MIEILGSLQLSLVYIGVNVLVCTVPHPWKWTRPGSERDKTQAFFNFKNYIQTSHGHFDTFLKYIFDINSWKTWRFQVSIKFNYGFVIYHLPRIIKKCNVLLNIHTIKRLWFTPWEIYKITSYWTAVGVRNTQPCTCAGAETSAKLSNYYGIFLHIHKLSFFLNSSPSWPYLEFQILKKPKRPKQRSCGINIKLKYMYNKNIFIWS